jgi:biotin carboxyl carrier protein
MTKFKLAFLDKQNVLNVTRQGASFHVEWNGRSLECRLRFLEDSYYVLELINIDGTRRTIHAAGSANGDHRQLWVDGRMANYQRVRQRGGEANQEGSLAATIPAVVTQILVAPGDKVSAGEKLVLLESMKLIIPIQAPYDSLVKAIHCQEGESVQAGIQLIELTRKEEE